MNIKESYNTYWIESRYMYLDEIEATVYKHITFDEFARDFKFYDYDEREWLGNNPFCKNEVIRYWLENEQCFVEIHVIERTDNTGFTINKVIANSYYTTNELVKDIMDLNDLYASIVDAFKDYMDELKMEDEEDDE